MSVTRVAIKFAPAGGVGKVSGLAGIVGRAVGTLRGVDVAGADEEEQAVAISSSESTGTVLSERKRRSIVPLMDRVKARWARAHDMITDASRPKPGECSVMEPGARFFPAARRQEPRRTGR
jgi:hypothetical protein